MRMSESIKNEESSNSSTWHIDGGQDGHEFMPGLPGMVECRRCGKMKPDVTYVANPYDQDIHNEIVMEWLCNDCYQEYCDDI